MTPKDTAGTKINSDTGDIPGFKTPKYKTIGIRKAIKKFTLIAKLKFINHTLEKKNVNVSLLIIN